MNKGVAGPHFIPTGGCNAPQAFPPSVLSNMYISFPDTFPHFPHDLNFFF